MGILSRDFLGGHAELIPSHNGSNGHARPGNMRGAALDAVAEKGSVPTIVNFCSDATVRRPEKQKAERAMGSGPNGA